ncbi:MAG: polyphosphate polymerase domain-containing protein [Clostridia bacterium]|nr:polyphosphate polymerase domain-containing protein [Clostridia bacterium]
MNLMFQTVFKRYEKKYILNSEQYKCVKDLLSYNTVPDEYGESLVCNIYYDTPDSLLIRRSLEKPVYKEKFRIRTYGVPKDHSVCFAELKKKYKGIVYKRRLETDYKNAILYMNGGENNICDSQIKKEIDYFKNFYGVLVPKVCLFYKRTAYYDREDRNLRFTFDSDIIYRDCDLELKNGVYGERLLENGLYLMEVKTAGAMPAEFTRLLSELQIYPASFSKYGTAYKSITEEKKQLLKGEDY